MNQIYLVASVQGQQASQSPASRYSYYHHYSPTRAMTGYLLAILGILVLVIVYALKNFTKSDSSNRYPISPLL